MAPDVTTDESPRVDEGPARAHVQVHVIEDFRPLSKSLEWRLADVHWRQAGTLPFTQNEVPFLVNNSGHLSEAAARVLLANCLDSQAGDGPIGVLELGAGTGLFALLFLNCFRSLCSDAGHDFYERLRYFVTDASPAAVEQWQERGLFADHAAHVVCLAADANAPEIALGGPVRAVFCNYLLDVLPTAMVRRAADGRVEQLCVRTHLSQVPVPGPPGSPRTLAEIRALAASGDDVSLGRLLSVMSFFEYEAAFRPDGIDRLPGAEEALAAAPAAARVRLSVGALACLAWSAAHLKPDGFILVSDFGPVTPEEMPRFAAAQRFGKTVAAGVNFPWLETELERRGLRVLKATGDDTRTLHSRLVGTQVPPETIRAFEERFSAAFADQTETLLEEARQHVAAGRRTEAVQAFQQILSRHRFDWVLHGEVADFLLLFIHDYPMALDVARSAVEINPHYSCWVWNTLGDAFANLGRHGEAHDAYLRAERVDPRDPCTNLNLAYTYLQSGAHSAALDAIRRGLENDVRGRFRDTLLEKQREVLNAISERHAAAEARIARRNERLSVGDLPK